MALDQTLEQLHRTERPRNDIAREIRDGLPSDRAGYVLARLALAGHFSHNAALRVLHHDNSGGLLDPPLPLGLDDMIGNQLVYDVERGDTMIDDRLSATLLSMALDAQARNSANG